MAQQRIILTFDTSKAQAAVAKVQAAIEDLRQEINQVVGISAVTDPKSDTPE